MVPMNNGKQDAFRRPNLTLSALNCSRFMPRTIGYGQPQTQFWHILMIHIYFPFISGFNFLATQIYVPLSATSKSVKYIYVSIEDYHVSSISPHIAANISLTVYYQFSLALIAQSVVYIGRCLGVCRFHSRVRHLSLVVIYW